MNYCDQCGSELVENARFCSNCGTHTSFKNKISGFGKRLKFKAKKSIDSIKRSLDEQLSTYIRQLDQGQDVKIGGITVPKNRRNGVRNAMLHFQNKYFEGDPNQEASYEEWVQDLPNRLEEHNCIVCFSKWDSDSMVDIVVCPHCSSGGHRDHLANWIKSKKYCPLCRESVEFSEFIKLS